MDKPGCIVLVAPYTTHNSMQSETTPVRWEPWHMGRIEVLKGAFFRASWWLRRVKVYALVGRSGTGKSFRAKLISQKYGLDLIIDDGLLIKNEKILAGQSAKKERHYLSAIKTALFENPAHRRELKKALDAERFKKVLVIGTSEKMVRRITDRLFTKPQIMGKRGYR